MNKVQSEFLVIYILENTFANVSSFLFTSLAFPNVHPRLLEFVVQHKYHDAITNLHASVRSRTKTTPRRSMPTSRLALSVSENAEHGCPGCCQTPR
jgi:hypothetical protein